MRINQIKQEKEGKIRGTLNFTDETAGNGNKYLKCKLGFATDDTITINIFENTTDKNDVNLYEKVKTIPSGSIVEYELRYDGKNGKYENFTILDIEVLKKGKSMDVVDVPTIKAKFREIVNFVKEQDSNLGELIEDVYSDKDVSKKAFISPFSENSGYNYRCGNATQTLRLCYLCEAIANMYNNWDLCLDGNNTRISLPLLYTASFLSNVGKAMSLEIEEESIIRTYEGQLHNDMLITMEIINKHLEKSKLTDEQKSILKHIIASSKESTNFGALEIPRTDEAVLFSLAEKMNTMMGAFETMRRDSLGDFHQIYQKVYCLTNYGEI